MRADKRRGAGEHSPRLNPAKAVLRRLLALIICAAPISAVAASLQERLAQCYSCHGEDGESPNVEVPSLGGQSSPYLLIQLYLFREKQRKVELMNEAAKGLSDADLQTFADAIAKLPPPKPAAANQADKEKLLRGQQLVQRYRCNVCHSADLSGHDNVPRIGAQREDYLIKALREYKDNTRHGYDASMAEVLQPVSDAEIVDLAYYIARQP